MESAAPGWQFAASEIGKPDRPSRHEVGDGDAGGHPRDELSATPARADESRLLREVEGHRHLHFTDGGCVLRRTDGRARLPDRVSGARVAVSYLAHATVVG